MKASLQAPAARPGTAATPGTFPAVPGVAYAIRSAHDGVVIGEGAPAFTFRVPSMAFANRLWRLDAYRAGLKFLRGEFDVEGDLVAAVRSWSRHAAEPRLAASLFTWLARMRPERWWQSRTHAQRNIAFHYDQSNEFYRTFLDRRMVYSCAYFERPDATLEEAQEAKLDLVCRKLDLGAADSFLDVGCGWGALVTWAVERYGSRATGCTLSPQQYDAAIRLIGERGLADRTRIELRDYRDVDGRFTKIASVGMVEHVGRSRLRAYFRTLAARLTDDGLVLNHAIARPSTVRTDAASHFLQRRVFPGGELVSIGEMIAAAEHAGFEAIDVENLRPHYARTCRAWVDRLQANRDACERIVGQETYRTWLLYLAASSASFADGVTEVFQLLLAKRGTRRTLINRRYMYDTPPR